MATAWPDQRHPFRPKMKNWSALTLALWIAACTPPVTSQAPLKLSAAQAESELRAASCSPDTEKYDPSPIALDYTPAPLGSGDEIAAALPKTVSFLGGWHLTSPNAEFGGLSGLEILPSGDLLSVSDRGYAVTIGMSEATPNGEAMMTPLLGADGNILTGKAEGDAEGLAYREGLAFISFERRHRVLAFDFGRCGVAAKGVFFAGLPKAKLGARIAANDGAEALAFHPDGRVKAGYETVINGQAPLVVFDADGVARDEPDFIDVAEGFKLVGADDDFILLRAYDTKQGNRNIISGPKIEFKLAPPLAVDNFEGIAVQKTKTGNTQIYIISDDNFSNRQRTLLYHFEVTS